jgi:hypothetical protein
MIAVYTFYLLVNRSATNEEVVNLFKQAVLEDPIKSLQALYNLRDVRGGKGEKKHARDLFNLIKFVYVELYKEMLADIIEYGSFKDLLEVAMLSDNSAIEAEYFANQLQIDNDALDARNDALDTTITLCAKWAPSEGSVYDKKLKICSHIRKHLNMSPKEYRHMLTKLRSKINLVETNMSTRNFELIQFEQVPSKCHMIHRYAFDRTTNAKGVEDPERLDMVSKYAEYKEKLSNRATTIKFKGIHVHEIIEKILSSGPDPILEAQWSAIVEDIKKVGTFKNSIAISDVSSSMNGQPMMVSIALGLLIAECCEGPNHNKIITFSSEPELHDIQGNSLYERSMFVQDMKWGSSTNMTAVFELLLKQPVMVDTIFLLTDMQFNCAVSNFNDRFQKDNTKFFTEDMKSLFIDCVMPKIVCWNLRSETTSVPMTSGDEGIVSLSGFSTEMLKAVIKYGIVNPITLMDEILAKYVISDNCKQMLQSLGARISQL